MGGTILAAFNDSCTASSTLIQQITWCFTCAQFGALARACDSLFMHDDMTTWCHTGRALMCRNGFCTAHSYSAAAGGSVLCAVPDHYGIVLS